MKRYHDYKKHNSFLLSLMLLGILIIPPFAFLHAQTVQEIRSKIDQKSSEILKLEEQIRIYQNELNNLGKQKDSLSVSIKQLDVTRKKLNADISVTQNKIDKTNLEIQSLSSDIGDKESSIRTNTDFIKSEIRRMNELENTSLIETVLSHNNFTIIWNDIDNIITVRESMRDNINQLQETKIVLEDTREQTIEAKNELTRLKTQLSDQQKIVVQNTSEKNKLLAQTKNNEANYQKLVAEQLAKRVAFEKELRDYESQLQFILDPSKLPNAGVLSWPLDHIFVTQEFGAKTGPHRTYTSGHSGTDFRARTPLPAKAMADGIVRGIGDTDLSCPGVSFGRWIFLEYNNGLSSTYGHLSLISVSEGQRVRRGEVVGYTGGTGRVTGPHLHVSLYASRDAEGNPAVNVDAVPSISCPGKILKQPTAAINAYLDPMYYLPPLR
ncbi:MAG: peptidoglycan DD-metalloendopeptidase family protein [Candidatus Paceibacterota bacterium]